MGITHTDKTISESRIACDGTLNVTLSITAQPDAAPCPADIALVLDRSGSMAGAPMTHLQAGAKDFIDMVLTRTAASQAAAGSRIGIVSFDGTALADVPLTDDCAALQEAVDALRAQGSTNHADAFLAAGELLGDTTRKRVLVIFTDGETTVGADPAPLAQRLRESGVEIYCVGLVGRTGLDESTLRAWANEPAGRYVVTRDSAEQLEDAFHCLADVIAAPGASDIHLRDFVSDDFTILDFEPPALGEAELEDARSIHRPSPDAKIPQTPGSRTGSQTMGMVPQPFQAQPMGLARMRTRKWRPARQPPGPSGRTKETHMTWTS